MYLTKSSQISYEDGEPYRGHLLFARGGYKRFADCAEVALHPGLRVRIFDELLRKFGGWEVICIDGTGQVDPIMLLFWGGTPERRA